ncbi:MAG: type 2 isopentenyl-diphosphate Delta-isomerase [Candidatus Undinarchaeales archaeon]|jgi:isopentenyl-diphosphate delta-isomerase|nr:type 2 isopentenyl-diphosphate Delta-isomerase [Candidatus Undinarchaeales archaeon]
MNSTQTRKSDHIRICTEKSIESKKSTLLECVELEKGNASNVDYSIELFGKKLNYPIIIAGMTGGVAEAEQINKNLAKAAEQLGLGFGVGSQRAMLENPELQNTYEVRDVAPNILLFGNIGASQLSEYSIEQIENSALAIGSDVLAVHLNEIQEKLQPEGTWKNYSEQLKQLCSSLKIPVIVKETGMGISEQTANSLKDSGIAGIDIGGAGGTSFACVELERSGENTDGADSGIPTAASILQVRKVFQTLPLIATGGIRSGEDIAKAIALGADTAGIALPLLKPAQESSEAVLTVLERFISELKQIDIKQSKPKITGELSKWV